MSKCGCLSTGGRLSPPRARRWLKDWWRDNSALLAHRPRQRTRASASTTTPRVSRCSTTRPDRAWSAAATVWGTVVALLALLIMLPWGPTQAPADNRGVPLGQRRSVRNAVTPTRQSSVGTDAVPEFMFDEEELNLESALGPVQHAPEEHPSSEDRSDHDRSVGGKWKKRDPDPASQGAWAPSPP